LFFAGCAREGTKGGQGDRWVGAHIATTAGTVSALVSEFLTSEPLSRRKSLNFLQGTPIASSRDMAGHGTATSMKRHSRPFALWHIRRRGLQVLIAGVIATLAVAAILAIASG
jgi:hypothetical protein